MGDGGWVKTAAAAFPWAVAVVLTLALTLLLFGGRVGCGDYAADAGVESTCTSGPGIGVPGLWAWGGASVAALAYCGYRIIRAGRGQ